MPASLAARGVRARLLAAAVVSLGGMAAWGLVNHITERDDPLSDLPSVLLWAWERPEDLRFIDPDRTGVAVLAGAVYLSGERIDVRPRMQPLRLPEGAVVIPVVRIETDPVSRPRLDDAQRAGTLRAVLALTLEGPVSVIQIDFDAVASERAFYTDLIGDLRAALPPATRISITALASWCLGDPWIAGLPIDEAVPMLFQMGPDSRDVHRMLLREADCIIGICRNSLGISTGEGLPARPARRRSYIFHPTVWSATAANQALKEAETWR